MDDIMCKRFKNGDKTVFKALYESYSQRALRLARAVTRSDSLAADAVQEAFIRAYIYRGKYDPQKPFELWLNKILVNECRRLMGRDKRQAQLAQKNIEAADKVHTDTHSFERYESLYEALEYLPDAHRIPLVLKYCQGYSEEDIAGILGVPKSTVKSRLFHARRKMKARLEKYPKRGVR